MFKHFHRGNLAVALLLVAGGSLFADDPQPEPKPAAKPATGANPSPRPAERPAFWQGDQNVSEETRQAVRDAQQAFRESTKTLNEQLRQARRGLEDLVFAEKPDVAAIKNKTAEIGRLEGEVATFRAQMISTLRPKLTPEQLARFKSYRADLAQPTRERRAAGEGSTRPAPPKKQE